MPKAPIFRVDGFSAVCGCCWCRWGLGLGPGTSFKGRPVGKTSRE
jgi:hypothetical protein